jgi:predicted GTPase
MEKFKAYAPQREYTAFGRAFASWIGRVQPEPMPVSKPKARDIRIDRAVEHLKAGASRDEARVFVDGEEEWNKALEMVGGAL